MRGRNRSRGYERPTLEAPLRVAGLKAWFDSRTDANLAFSGGSSVQTWTSRAGSLGAITWTQATGANQATRATGVSALGNKNALLFDGSNDFYTSSTTNDWKFLHDGTGGELFWVGYCDSTGGTSQTLFRTEQANTNIGVLYRPTTLASVGVVANGSGTYCNVATLSAAVAAQDVGKWGSYAYTDELLSVFAGGGATFTQADVVGQEPSASNPSLAATLGGLTAAAQPFKGYIAQVLFYDHVLSAGERAALGTWAAAQFGVAA